MNRKHRSHSTSTQDPSELFIELVREARELLSSTRRSWPPSPRNACAPASARTQSLRSQAPSSPAR